MNNNDNPIIGYSAFILIDECYEYNENACYVADSPEALAYAVVEGYDSRESVIEFFGTLFNGKEAEEISDFWGLLAGIVCDLYPKEIMDVIKQAYVDELILPGMIRYWDRFF